MTYQVTRTSRQYTIEDAALDIKHLAGRFDEMEAERKALRDEVDQLRHEEWKALHLCKMLQRRLDMAESMILLLLKPEGQAYLTHAVLNELRADRKREQLQ